MTTNIDRAARAVWEASRGVGAPLSVIASDHIAAALADATPPLLMPALPEPDIDGLWRTEHEKTRSYVRIGSVYEDNDRIVVSDYEGSRRTSMYLTLEEARDMAYTLLAAADYAEEHTDTEENS